jgi:hypothetical protein
MKKFNLILTVLLLVFLSAESYCQKDKTAAARLELKNDIDELFNGYTLGFDIISGLNSNCSQLTAWNDYALAKSKFMQVYTPQNYSACGKIVNLSVQKIDNSERNKQFLDNISSGFKSFSNEISGLASIPSPAGKLIEVITNSVPEDDKADLMEDGEFKNGLKSIKNSLGRFDQAYQNIKNLSAVDKDFSESANKLLSKLKAGFASYTSPLGQQIQYEQYRTDDKTVLNQIEELRNAYVTKVNNCKTVKEVDKLRGSLDGDPGIIQMLQEINKLNDLKKEYQGDEVPKKEFIDTRYLVHRAFKQTAELEKILSNALNDLKFITDSDLANKQQFSDNLNDAAKIVSKLIDGISNNSLYQVDKPTIKNFSDYAAYKFAKK